MTAMSQPMQVLTSRNTVEWYTPPDIVEYVRKALGEIDLDPASSLIPQRWIRANWYWTDFGLERPWFGRVFLNPPFSDSARWISYLIKEYESGRVREAVALINSNLGYRWYEELWVRYTVCCARERIRFIREDGVQGGQAKRGQTFVYLGKDSQQFTDTFQCLGRIIRPDQPV